MTRKNARYGWVPDLPDHRDFLFAAPMPAGRVLPKKVDLRTTGFLPKPYNQGQLGSCTANAIGAAMEFDLHKDDVENNEFTPSRLFIYYNERKMLGTIEEDSGAMIRDGVKSVARLGAPPEPLWPYSDANPGQFTVVPPPPVYVEAKKHRVLSYQRLRQTPLDLKKALAAGFPFVFGFSVYESFEDENVSKTGKGELPSPYESPVGGHAVLAVGYDDETSRFLIQNSWGEGWGDKGYFTLPYEYLTDPNLSADFWVIRAVKP